MPGAPLLCRRCGAAPRELHAHHPAVVTAGPVELLCASCEAARRSIEAWPLTPETRLAVADARAVALFGEEQTDG